MDCNNNVSHVQTGGVRRALRVDIFDQDSVLRGQVQCSSQSRCDRANKNSNLMVMHMMFRPDLTADRTHQVAGTGEPHSFIAAGLGKNEGIYADDLSRSVHQWAPTVSWIDRCVSLDIRQ